MNSENLPAYKHLNAKSSGCKNSLRFYLFIICLIVTICLFCLSIFSLNSSYAQQEVSPIVVDGDTVEYSDDGKTVIAYGNVIVSYADTKLTCDKISVNIKTKDAQATGNVRLQDPRGILEAEELHYNFQTKTGDILATRLRASPYYYFGKTMQRTSENQYIITDGYFSSCNYDDPHFRLKSKRVEIFPDDKIVARSNRLYWMRIPFFYFPAYSHSLEDPFMKVQFKTGKTSDWGPYTLTAWRSDLNDNTRLRLYLDWRDNLGLASGFGLNYDTKAQLS